jgi:pimeloyl-ACP methyl ester carboxylesterase
MLRALPLFFVLVGSALAQNPPYHQAPPVEAPYHRVRYEASSQAGELIFPVQYTIWIPPGVKTLRGVVVHQHGCGEGSCKSGQTGAFDLHWQALARKHHCALLSPSYEQPQKADCQKWCDPRHGSGQTFQKALADFAKLTGHAELSKIPWALWGHSGGGHWAGGMTLLHPKRVVATWLRSGVPFLEPNPKRPAIQSHALPKAALGVPMMCNPGTKEGVTVKEGRFAGVWPANETFFKKVRSQGGLIGVAVDPLSSHECGNQRYLAIPWLDACLTARLPDQPGDPLKAMPVNEAWLAPLLGTTAVSSGSFKGDKSVSVWLPNESIATAWTHYIRDTRIPDTTPPPAPTNIRIKGQEISWQAEADLESGLASFVIKRDGKTLATLPEKPKNRFGRPLFQGLQYSDTPAAPLFKMRFVDQAAKPGKPHQYEIISVNTVGLKSK